MALTTLPGFVGFQYGRYSSMDKRAAGKLTDSNHLESFHQSEPGDYDKKIISLYTQTSLYSNDFLNMLQQSTPYYVKGNSDSWKWKVSVPYRFPKIIEIPDTTLSQSRIGIAGKEFDIVVDTAEFTKNAVLSVGSKMHGPNIVVIKDPLPYNAGFLLTCTLVAQNPQTDFISRTFLQTGVELELINGTLGEFDTDLLGLPRMADEVEMFETLGSAYGFEHTITAWADDKTLRDGNGDPLDILIYAQQRRNQLPTTKNILRWEPYVEFQMRKTMLETKVKRFIWQQAGTTKTNGSKQEIKKLSAGVYPRMKSNGNLVQYNKGEFSAALIRAVFGDLFYRRVDVKDRRVKLYTNEAGFDVFQTAVKQDAVGSGLSLMTEVPAIKTGNIGVGDASQHLVYSWAFDAMITRETGRVDLIHLKELDLPQTNTEFGQNKKSTPIFIVFDVSNTGDGSLVNNIREVRRENTPSMQWGYIDGRRHHLGAMASQGHTASSKFPGYTLWMEDRSDIFIEDLSKTVLIEELPQF